MLGQVPAGGAQVVDGAGAGLHAAGVVGEAGQLPSGQRRGLVPQQPRDVLLQTKASSPSFHILALKGPQPPAQTDGYGRPGPQGGGGRGLAGLTPGCQAQGWCSGSGGGTLRVSGRSRIRSSGTVERTFTAGGPGPCGEDFLVLS